jgi:hypothetical protein
MGGGFDMLGNYSPSMPSGAQSFGPPPPQTGGGFPIGTGPNISRGTPIGSADDLSNPYYHNSGIAGGMQKYGGSYTNGSSLIDPASLYSDPNMGGGAKGGRQPAPQDQATLPAPRLGAMVQPLQDQSPPSSLYSGDMSDNKIREDISARNQRGFQGMFDFEQPQIGQQQVDNYRLEMTNPDAYRQKLSSAQGLASLASQEPPMQGQPMGQVQPMARQVQPMARQVQPMARQVQFPRSRGR